MPEPVTEKITDKNYPFIPYRKHDIVEMCLQDGTPAIKKLDSRWDDYFVPVNV